MTTPNSAKPADYLPVAGRHQSVTFPRHVKHASIGVRAGNHILIYNSSIIPKKTHSFGKQPLSPCNEIYNSAFFIAVDRWFSKSERTEGKIV